MKNLNALIFLFLNLSFLSINSAMASFGGMEGGGGVGVLCKNSTKETLQLLEVWEAKNVYNLGYPKDYGSIDKNLTTWSREWMEAQGEVYDPNLYNIKKQLTKIFKPVPSLPLSNDFSKWRELPPNCEYIQIAKFIDPPNGTKRDELWTQSKLKIVMSLYKKLDDVNKAALLLHEFSYFAVRMLSNWRPLQYRSDEARIMVAAQITGNSQLVAPIAPNSTVCDFVNDHASNEFIHHFYAKDEINAGVHGVRFYFQWINGYIFPLKATTFVPGLTEAALKSGSLSTPININVSYDVKFSGVTLQSFKIQIKSSGDSSHPLKIIPLNLSNGLIANGECR